MTVVGEHIFAAKINSQLSSESLTDWRAANNILPHEKIQLPNELESKCLELNRYFKLNFSAIDFILDTNNEYFFLEINPNGQWAWIEQLLEYPISKAITDILLEM